MNPPVTPFDTPKILDLGVVAAVICPECGHRNRLERRRFTRDESVPLVCHSCEAPISINMRSLKGNLK